MTEQHGPLFEEMRTEIRKSTTGERQAALLARIDQLEKSSRDHSLRARLKALVLEIEEDAAELAPFMSRLSSLLP
ncbi:MAG: hypothetical protein JOY81_08305 [Alphaproteobacteria bacterium]|nr:hypothetical protein [Alphaproteobacteria bacterium]